MKQVSDTEVILEEPEDVQKACVFCAEKQAAEAVFYVEGYPTVGRCDCLNPSTSFLNRMKSIVQDEPDVHVRIGECRT